MAPKTQTWRFEVPKNGDEELHPKLQAASLALALMNHFGVRTWDEVPQRLRSDNPAKQVQLTSLQWDLLGVHEGDFVFLRGRHKESESASSQKMITMARCDTCTRFLFTGGNASKCVLKAGCEGNLIRVAAAKRVKCDPDPADDPQETLALNIPEADDLTAKTEEPVADSETANMGSE